MASSTNDTSAVNVGTTDKGFYWTVSLREKSPHCPTFITGNGHKWQLHIQFATVEVRDLTVTCVVGNSTTPFDTVYNAECVCELYKEESSPLGSWQMKRTELNQEAYNVVPGVELQPKPLTFRCHMQNKSSLQSFKCKVKVEWPQKDHFLSVQEPNSSGAANALLDGLPRMLLESHHLCDVTLKVNDTELKAHKNVLSLHSDVFAAMFRHDLQEANSGCVDIIDLTEQGVRAMLQCMYCNAVEFTSNQEALDAFAAAKKYHIAALEVACRTHLFSHLEMESAMEVSMFAHLHGESLRRAACSFIGNEHLAGN